MRNYAILCTYAKGPVASRVSFLARPAPTSRPEPSSELPVLTRLLLSLVTEGTRLVVGQAAPSCRACTAQDEDQHDPRERIRNRCVHQARREGLALGTSEGEPERREVNQDSTRPRPDPQPPTSLRGRALDLLEIGTGVSAPTIPTVDLRLRRHHTHFPASDHQGTERRTSARSRCPLNCLSSGRLTGGGGKCSLAERVSSFPAQQGQRRPCSPRVPTPELDSHAHRRSRC